MDGTLPAVQELELDGITLWVTAGFALAIVLLRAWLKARTASFRARRRADRALRGEDAAVDLLERAGYRIEARQVGTRWPIRVGGEEVEIALRADYLVRRGGRRWVAEVKTGEQAPSLSHAPTRRQILEYRHAFDVDGALLVEPERGAVTEVHFPHEAASPARQERVLWVTLGAVIGALGAHLLQL